MCTYLALAWGLRYLIRCRDARSFRYEDGRGQPPGFCPNCGDPLTRATERQ